MLIALVDVGGTAVKTAVYEGEGDLSLRPRMLGFPEEPTSPEGGPGILLQILRRLSRFEGIDALGIATAGQVDSAGRIRYANPNIPNYTGLHLREELERRLRIPVVVENDVNAAALGEARFGAGRNFGRFLCLTFGTGIGGALVEGGRVERGAHGAAGEFGMTLTHADLSVPGDVLSGCYETFASVSALVREARKIDPALDSGKAIFARRAEPAVADCLSSWKTEAALGLVSLVHAFDPEAVLLGGGIMEVPGLAADIEERVLERLMPSFRSVRFLPCELGNAAGLCGALVSVIERIS